MKELAIVFSLLINYLPNPIEPWQSPLAEPLLLQQYLAPASEYSAGHRGIDLAAELDQTVYAPVSGIVSYSGKVGYRQVLSINTLQGTITFEPVCSNYAVGSAIQIGQPIGAICQPDAEYSWHCDAPCMHLGLKTSSGYLSPEVFIFGMSPSRLLP